ncbi:MAG: NADH-quinone oxidoreductase subunit C [Planctomycetota bacterium]|nr:NADH-quinone oxidoreductase subunit C [Planctomycetota bacterium]MDA1140992.1 NADH-quinone oxidoreductase subunit C [Planctomycetota bacterium]
MISEELVNALIENPAVSREEVENAYRDPEMPVLMVDADSVADVCQFLRDTKGYEFNFLKNITAVDFEEHMHVVYHLYSMDLRHKIMIKVQVGREQPVVQSVEPVWCGANWQEREVYDLFGIKFAGHSDLRRIMLPEDWQGYPLRKDYVHEPDHYD